MCTVLIIPGGGGSGLDYVIELSEGGWVLITVDYGGGGGGVRMPQIDYVICERPLNGRPERTLRMRKKRVAKELYT